MDAIPRLIRKSSDWLTARSGDSVMMMSIAEGIYLGLNPMGGRIWDLLDATDDRDKVCARLVEEFAVSQDQCIAEVDTFLADLARLKAIEYYTPTAG